MNQYTREKLDYEFRGQNTWGLHANYMHITTEPVLTQEIVNGMLNEAKLQRNHADSRNIDNAQFSQGYYDVFEIACLSWQSWPYQEFVNLYRDTLAGLNSLRQ